METKNEEESDGRCQELRDKLEELRESREHTENTLKDCRLRWERMKDEELDFGDREDMEDLLEGYDEDIGIKDGSQQRSLVINDLTFLDKENENKDPREKTHNICALLNLIWMELIGLVLTVYTFLRPPKRKM